jgi:Sporulation related domain.
MENDKYQKELFEGFEQPKKAAPRFGSIFPRTDLAITLTPEKMVFAAIGIIMLMVIFFALGVEKGKSAAYAKFKAAKPAVKNMVAVQSILAVPSRTPIVVARSPVAANIPPKAVAETAPVKAQAAIDKTKPFTVSAGSFIVEDSALTVVSRLKAAGLEAYVYYKEPHYVACVGSFQNRDAAGKTLNTVKQMYKDAFIRLK